MNTRKPRRDDDSRGGDKRRSTSRTSRLSDSPANNKPRSFDREKKTEGERDFKRSGPPSGRKLNTFPKNDNDRKPAPRTFIKRDDAGSRKPFGSNDENTGFKRPVIKRSADGEKSYGKKSDDSKPGFKSGDKPFRKREGFEKKTFSRNDDGRKPYKRDDDRPSFRGKDDKFEKRSFNKPDDARRDSRPPSRSSDRPESGFKRAPGRGFENKGDTRKPFVKYGDREQKGEARNFRGPSDRPSADRTHDRKPYPRKEYGNKDYTKAKGRSKKSEDEDTDKSVIRLNRFLSNAGIASRREADDLISSGVVSVNGQVVTELGTKVNRDKDEIRYNGELVKRDKLQYVLLNKPKDFITTTEDPHERRTVMALVERLTDSRLYPVGRLDRNTTGVLLLTNDGDLTMKLTHPKFGITKLYAVELDKKLRQDDFFKIQGTVELEDGPVQVDQVAYIEGEAKNHIGIELHSGRNRVVRRIFESLGYKVVKLDRTSFAGLSKKGLKRGECRFLTEAEVGRLKKL
jgi:23S rRNA pseudouridine2605 synthase